MKTEEAFWEGAEPGREKEAALPGNEKAAESRLGGFSLGVGVTRLDSQGIERWLVDRGGGVEAVISLITDEGFTR